MFAISTPGIFNQNILRGNASRLEVVEYLRIKFAAFYITPAPHSASSFGSLGTTAQIKLLAPSALFRGWRVGPNSIFGKGQLAIGCPASYE
jgi:hypothetical protein